MGFSFLKSMIQEKRGPVNSRSVFVKRPRRKFLRLLQSRKGMKMKIINVRKYSYVFLWLALLLTVGIVWFFGSREKEKESGTVSSQPPASSSQIASAGESSAPAAQTAVKESGEELVGVWIPYMSLTTAERTQEAFEANFKSIADSAKAKGINTLFVHVRPFSDALYPSALYPWSHILTGEQGKDPGFDPLAFMVQYAHESGMELHAWLNPLRIKSEQTPAVLAENNIYNQLHNDYPAYFMTYGDGIYLNPAYSYVRSLIADGAAEIVQNYAVDGVHFDDYFYPSQDEALDAESYGAYCERVETPLSLLRWRQANISALVAEVYQKVKQANPEAVFGISPQGNLENDRNMGADVDAWCAVSGYIDYICPQLYYSFDNEALGYTEALEQWMALPRHEGLEVYAGLALYKAGTDADGGTWTLQSDTIKRQIEAARGVECAGIILYSSDYLDREETREEVANAAALLTEG